MDLGLNFGDMITPQYMNSGDLSGQASGESPQGPTGAPGRISKLPGSPENQVLWIACAYVLIALALLWSMGAMFRTANGG